MDLVRHQSPARDSGRILLVMLPGVGIEAADFAEHGFIGEVQQGGLAIDVVAARPELDLYLDRTIAEELHRLVVAPALAAGQRRIWFLGLSLGGMGALLHARDYGAIVEGVILLSPFLGTPGLVEEVSRAGGIAAWQPRAVAANDSERQLMAYLKQHLAVASPRPALYLGYGRDDRFARGHALLGEALPAERVVLAEGGHDWPTWSRLWRNILALHPFARKEDE